MFQQGARNSDDLVNTVLTDQPVFLEAVQTGEVADGVFSYRFRHYLPHKGWGNVAIDAGTVHSAIGMSKMAEKGIVVHDTKLFMNYVRTAVDQYHQGQAPQTRYEQYGWKRDDTCFLYGRYLYTSAGKITVGGNDEVEIRQRWLGPRKGGSLRVWTDTCDKLFQHQMEALAATVLASPAAALIKFCSTLEGGAIIHLFTPGSGKGKSTALQGGWSFWGEKFGTSLTGIDTKVSKPIVIGTLANLPVFHDELIDRDPEVIKKFIEMFTEGRDRMRGTQSGGIRHVLATWSTVLITAANKSLVELLPFDGTDAAGFRVLELTCVLNNPSGSVEGDKMKRILEENAGHAADRFVQYLVAPGVREWCQEAVDQWMKDIWEKTKLGNEHRFRVRLVAAIAVAGMICNKLEILNFSTQRIVDYLLAELVKDSNAGTVSKLSPIDRASQALGEFLNEHQGQTLIVADAYRPKQQPAHAIVEPKGKLAMRCELRSKRLYLSQGVFRKWCGDRGLSARIVIDTLIENRVVVGQPNKTLTAGTFLPGSQVQSLEINMDHPLMSGFVVAVEQLQVQQAEAAGLVLPPRS